VPPVPLPEQAHPRCHKVGVLSGFSFGAIGHPIYCAGPCKYLSMARGCKDGQACDRCHLCAWSGRQQGAPGLARPPGLEAPARGAALAAKPAKPGERMRSTRPWTSEPPRPPAPTVKPAPQPPEVCPPPPRAPQPAARCGPEPAGAAAEPCRAERAAEELEKMSLGSVNHPHSCAKACKYFRKPRGCK
ncbi:unnamed protein product, partial [Prorocentrum cordatum]